MQTQNQQQSRSATTSTAVLAKFLVWQFYTLAIILIAQVSEKGIYLHLKLVTPIVLRDDKLKRWKQFLCLDLSANYIYSCFCLFVRSAERIARRGVMYINGFYLLIQFDFQLFSAIFIININIFESHQNRMYIISTLYQTLIINNNKQIANHMQKEELVKLLSQSDIMTEQLQELKNSILNNSLERKYEKPSQIVMSAIQHRSLLRTLAQALQANRNLVQIKKQKIQKSRILLEGLESYKKTLKDQILGFHTNVESIQQYFEQPIGQIDWEKNYQSGQSRLKASLQKLKHKDELYKNKLIQKTQLQKQINDKSKLYNSVMPKHVKKLNEQLLQTTKIFGIEMNQNLQRIDNAQLAYIYDILKTLKIAQKIDVVYNKQQHQYLDLIIKPAKLELYERTLKYNIKLEQKQLKIRISNLQPEFNKLVIGVDRRCDFSTKDIFHRLINRQDAKPLFEQPSNESQRNMNNKFIYVDWLQDYLSVSAFKSSQFLSTIRNRSFTVALTKYIFDNIKNPVWLGPINPILPIQLTSKRFIIESDVKISFFEYKQLINIPNSVKRSINKYEQRCKKQSTASSQRPQQLNKMKKKLLQVLSKLCMEQLIIPDLYQYHKLTISYKGLKVQAVIIIPYEYPTIQPKFKIINFDRTSEQQNNDILPSIECKARIIPSNTNTNKNSPNQNYSLQLQTLQTLLTSSSTISQEGSEQFNIIYHLNKLFTSLYRMQNQLNKGYK